MNSLTHCIAFHCIASSLHVLTNFVGDVLNDIIINWSVAIGPCYATRWHQVRHFLQIDKTYLNKEQDVSFSLPSPSLFLSTHNRPGAIALDAVIHNAALRNAVQLCAENATLESETDSVRFSAPRRVAELNYLHRPRFGSVYAILTQLWYRRDRNKKEGKKNRRQSSARGRGRARMYGDCQTRCCVVDFTLWKFLGRGVRMGFHFFLRSFFRSFERRSVPRPFSLSFDPFSLATILIPPVSAYVTRSTVRHQDCFTWTWETASVDDYPVKILYVRACVRLDATCSRRYSLPIRTDSNKRHRSLFRTTAVQWRTEVQSIVCTFFSGIWVTAFVCIPLHLVCTSFTEFAQSIISE